MTWVAAGTGVLVAAVAGFLALPSPAPPVSVATSASNAASMGSASGPATTAAAARAYAPPAAGKLLLAQRKRDLEARIVEPGNANVDDLKLEASIVGALARAMQALATKTHWDAAEPKFGEQWIGVQLRDLYVESAFFTKPSSVPAPLARMFDPSAPAAQVDARALLAAPRAREEAWFAIALDVRPRDWPASFTDGVVRSESFGGMRLVYQLLVHELARRTWPDDLPEGFATWTESVASRLGAEASSELDFGTLEAARCAVLLAGHFPERVKRRAIEAIVAAQGKEGLWREAGDAAPDAHATYFAIWALAGYQEHLMRPPEPTN
jgi:hypothetical protein